MASIRISEKHGVNPSLDVCYICGRAKGVLLLGRLAGDAQAPREICRDKEPCDKCKEYMLIGIIFISVRDGWNGVGEPYRTGKLVVIKEEAVKEITKPGPLLDSILRSRVCFIEDQTWDRLGMPKETSSHSEPEAESSESDKQGREENI